MTRSRLILIAAMTVVVVLAAAAIEWRAADGAPALLSTRARRPA